MSCTALILHHNAKTVECLLHNILASVALPETIGHTRDGSTLGIHRHQTDTCPIIGHRRSCVPPVMHLRGTTEGFTELRLLHKQLSLGKGDIATTMS